MRIRFISWLTLAAGAAFLVVATAAFTLPVVAALALESFAAFLARFRAHLIIVEKTMGGLLIVAGVAFFSGWITDLGSWLIEAFPELGKLAM